MYGGPGRPGPSRQVRRTTAEKLLAVSMADMADGTTVPAGPTCKRVQQLRDAGATWTEIGEQLGMNRSNSHALSKRRRVQAGTARAVHDLWTRWKSGEWTPHGRRPGGHAKAKLEREAANAT